MKVLGYISLKNEGWTDGGYYDDNEINKIADPNNQDTVTCSVPSPFARLERVKTAFENISNSADLKAKQGIASREDEKIVSQTLDIAELVYQRAIVKQLRFSHWDAKEAQTRASNSNNAAIKQFIETLTLYLGQDTQFNPTVNGQVLPVRDFYLINYNNTTIGSTSPSTLFAPADIDFRNIKATLDGNRDLFTNNVPLYNRDPNFQKFLYYLYDSQPSLIDVAKAFYEYLDKSLQHLKKNNSTLYDNISDIKAPKDEDAAERKKEFTNTLTDNGFQPISIAGFNIPAKDGDAFQQTLQKSGFCILANKNVKTDNNHPDNTDNRIPLVLPPKDDVRDYATIPYFNGCWNKNITVPYFDSNPLSERMLPGLNNIQYPYLTVSDFLEPTLIELPYPISSDFYSYSNGKNGYLLPLKPKFFEFFTTDDLFSSSSDKENKPKLQIIEGKSGITVHLFIPIEQNGVSIRFTRHYLKGNDTANEQDNQGNIVSINFALALYPKIKLNANAINNENDDRPKTRDLYKVQAVINQTKNPSFDLKFFRKNIKPQNAITTQWVPRLPVHDNKETFIKSLQYTIEKDFDYIQLNNNTKRAKGILIPKWEYIDEQNQENNAHYFAIDFGTTNTHIEYVKTGVINPKSFDIGSSDAQLATLLDKSFVDYCIEQNLDTVTTLIDLHDTTLREFLPKYISANNSPYSFPQRTVIAYSDKGGIENMRVLNHSNIPFVYHKKDLQGYQYQNNLKWVGTADKMGQKLAKLFLEQLLLLIRNKVLFNHGKLKNTHIIVFYPTSMEINNLQSLETTWQDLFKQYISQNIQQLTLLPESLAPYHYYKKHNQNIGGNVVSIDIGGGTTDVVLFNQENNIIAPKLITSFRFAANNIFGDMSQAGSADRHPLLKRYVEIYKTNLAGDAILNNVFQEILQRNLSAEVNAFLFSISQNDKYENNTDFHYERHLSQDKDYRIVFLYFYTAIIYHVAQWLKYYEQPAPKNFIFSGTGSKILNILDTNRFKILMPYTKQILESIFNKSDVEVQLNFDGNIAKAVTCKGGIYRLQELNNTENDDIQDLQKILVYDNFEKESILTYGIFNNDKGLHEKIICSVKEFNDFFYKLLTQNHNYHARKFGIESMTQVFKENCDKNLDTYLTNNITLLNQDADQNNPVTNAPFFYPIIGSIQNIMNAIDQTINDRNMP